MQVTQDMKRVHYYPNLNRNDQSIRMEAKGSLST